jgi:hypothetical protein
MTNDFRIINREGDRDIRGADGSVVRETRTWYQMGGQFERSASDTYTVSPMPCRGAFAPGWTEGRDGVWRRAIID